MQEQRRYLFVVVVMALALLAVIGVVMRPDLSALKVFAAGLAIYAFYVVVSFYYRLNDNDEPATQKNTASRHQILEDLSQSLSIPFMILAGSGRIVFISRRLSELFPYIKLGDHYSNLARASNYVDALKAAVGGETIEPFTFETHRMMDRVFLVYAQNIPPLDFGGVEGTLLVEIHDRTEERRGDVMRRDFIANASHELRTPLATISGGIETMREADDLDTMRHFLPIMQKEADRMQRLLRDLMALSKVEMNEHYPPEGTVDLRAVLDDSLNALYAEGTLKPASVEDRYEKGDVVRGDADQLQQIFINILDNANQYSGEPPKIEIERVADDPAYPAKIGIRITDNGAGIDQKDIPRLTERFYRVSKQESRNRGGTGLGLAIVKHMLRRHHGELQIRSRIGEGSAFTIWLPIK